MNVHQRSDRAFSAVSTTNVSRVFIHLTCWLCLLLQRFGATVSSGQVFLATLVYPLAVFALLLTGYARLRLTNSLLFSLMLLILLTSSIGGVLYPDPEMRFSLLSLAELILIYAAILPEPSAAFETTAVLPIVVGYLRLVAVAGLFQWALQFLGLRLFSFSGSSMLRPFLTEPGWHVVAPIAYGSKVLRSNGFFLLEPSVLSQFMALAIVLDLFVRRRALWLPLYAAAILASFSGTGMLALALGVVIGGLLTPRLLPRIALLLLVGGLVAAVAAVAFPHLFATLTARANGHDASSQIRYAAQLRVLGTIIDNTRVVLGFGPGAAEGYVQGVSGAMSPAMKLLFDYGIIGLIAFVAYLVKMIWRADAKVLSITCLAIFQVAGGTLVFAPWVFMIALTCVWSRPLASRTALRAPDVSRPRTGAAWRGRPSTA